MKARRSSGRLFGVLSVLSLLLGITFASSVTAQAQYGRDGQNRQDRDYERDRERDNNRDGDRDRDRNRDERRRHRRNDDRNRNDGYYGNGRNGNGRNGDYGGYGNNGRYGNNGGYGNNGYNVYQIAADRGYQAGLNTGASDAQRGQNYDPQRPHYHRSATGGYSPSHGNKEGDNRAHRDAFAQGDRQGLRP